MDRLEECARVDPTCVVVVGAGHSTILHHHHIRSLISSGWLAFYFQRAGTVSLVIDLSKT